MPKKSRHSWGIPKNRITHGVSIIGLFTPILSQ
jgi:hypothetical protein